MPFGIKHPDAELAEKRRSYRTGACPCSASGNRTRSQAGRQRRGSGLDGSRQLVFDEPTSGLDYDSMARLAALIQKLSAMGKVIFIVTHDYDCLPHLLQSPASGRRRDTGRSDSFRRKTFRGSKELFNVRVR